MNIPKNLNVWSETANKLHQAGWNHKIITTALGEAAKLWVKAPPNWPTAVERYGLPKNHPAYAIARREFPAILGDNASTGNLTYPVLLKLQVASAKVVFSLAASFRQSWDATIDDGLADDLLLINGVHPVGTLYSAKNTDPVEYMTDVMRQCWENAYRVGYRDGSRRLRENASVVPNQKLRRSDQFWLAYEAWLNLNTDRATAKRLKGLTGVAKVVELLTGLGVKVSGDYLIFPGVKTRVKQTSFGSQLSEWVKDFKDLAKA